MEGENRNLENIDRYIGKRIGNYRIDALLNSGAFGRVYKGVHLYLTHRVVAIKLLHATHLASSEERENFLQEAQFLELLKHAHILPIYDVGIDEEGFPYLVAEFAAGGSLRERIKRQRPQFLPLDEVLRILSEIGQALQFVHEQNIVHRDLKPENILFTAKDEAMLADFGIAVFLETTQTRYANVIGSPLYMAPEQFDGIASRRSDQYSLACIAYEMLAGRPPFVSNHPLTLGMKHQNEPPAPPSQFNPDIPEHIETALLKALAKKRDERYPDINAFITALISVPSGPLQRDQGQWLIEGQNLLHSRRYRQALVAFERALRYDPALVQAYEGKGEALLLLGQLNEALTAYDKRYG
ncbi:MAG: protein kinase [Ktedonobacteraceae bacterium]|nr:protein kinase [Ktedonobacteraceae bacterium]